MLFLLRLSRWVYFLYNTIVQLIAPSSIHSFHHDASPANFLNYALSVLNTMTAKHSSSQPHQHQRAHAFVCRHPSPNPARYAIHVYKNILCSVDDTHTHTHQQGRASQESQDRHSYARQKRQKERSRMAQLCSSRQQVSNTRYFADACLILQRTTRLSCGLLRVAQSRSQLVHFVHTFT